MKRKIQIGLLVCAVSFFFGCETINSMLSGKSVFERYPPNAKKGWVEFYSGEKLFGTLNTDFVLKLAKIKDGIKTMIGRQTEAIAGMKPKFRTDELPGPMTYEIILDIGGPKSAVTTADVHIEEGMLQLVHLSSSIVGRESSGYLQEKLVYSLRATPGGSIPLARDAASLEKLVEAVDHPDWGTRWYAARALEDMAGLMNDDADQRLRERYGIESHPLVKEAIGQCRQKYHSYKMKNK
ncbi:MAG: HEAT repeat domain-containing protein [Candidatus Aminicenantes bacterium]|nr:HEAT repeat domain-containing protein [Candidatus Aminicenantes bacterium]